MKFVNDVKKEVEEIKRARYYYRMLKKYEKNQMARFNGKTVTETTDDIDFREWLAFLASAKEKNPIGFC